MAYMVFAVMALASRVVAIDANSVRMAVLFFLRKNYPLREIRLIRTVFRAVYVFRCGRALHVVWNHLDGASKLVEAVEQEE